MPSVFLPIILVFMTSCDGKQPVEPMISSPAPEPDAADVDADTASDMDTDLDTDTATNVDANLDSDTGDSQGNVSTTLRLDIGDGLMMDLVLVPAGDDPQSRYTITNDYFIMTTEVTQGMFYALMGYQSYDGYSESIYPYGYGTDYPAYFINWDMGAAFANASTNHHNTINGTSLSLCYDCTGTGASISCREAVAPVVCDGFRFPTEAEWSKASFSGTIRPFWTGTGANMGGDVSSSDELSCSNALRIQDGGTNPLLGDYAWFCGNSNYSSQPVAQKRPNGFGLYDIHGNVWEWTADWWGCSFPSTNVDPHCDSTGTSRVIRGGDWGANPAAIRTTARSSGSPEYRSFQIGFRLVVSL